MLNVRKPSLEPPFSPYFGPKSGFEEEEKKWGKKFRGPLAIKSREGEEERGLGRRGEVERIWLGDVEKRRWVRRRGGEEERGGWTLV